VFFFSSIMLYPELYDDEEKVIKEIKEAAMSRHTGATAAKLIKDAEDRDDTQSENTRDTDKPKVTFLRIPISTANVDSEKISSEGRESTSSKQDGSSKPKKDFEHFAKAKKSSAVSAENKADSKVDASGKQRATSAFSTANADSENVAAAGKTSSSSFSQQEKMGNSELKKSNSEAKHGMTASTVARTDSAAEKQTRAEAWEELMAAVTKKPSLDDDDDNKPSTSAGIPAKSDWLSVPRKADPDLSWDAVLATVMASYGVTPEGDLQKDLFRIMSQVHSRLLLWRDALAF
jgi:hypothetical protein